MSIRRSAQIAGSRSELLGPFIEAGDAVHALHLVQDKVGRVDRLRVGKRVAVVGALAMITLAATFDHLDRLHQPNTSLFAWVVLSVLAIAAPLATLIGYILVSLELVPLKAVVLGIGTIPAAFLFYFALMVPFPAHLPIVRAVYLWVFVGCGVVAFTIGLLRFGLGLWRES